MNEKWKNVFLKLINDGIDIKRWIKSRVSGQPSGFLLWSNDRPQGYLNTSKTQSETLSKAMATKAIKQSNVSLLELKQASRKTPVN